METHTSLYLPNSLITAPADTTMIRYVHNFSFGRGCRGTKNHNLIDNMNKKLEQTHKKISDVKRKCTETAKTCLQMHVENVSRAFASIRSSLMSTSFIIYWGSHVLWIRSRNVKALINGCSIAWFPFSLLHYSFTLSTLNNFFGIFYGISFFIRKSNNIKYLHFSKQYP